MKIKLLLALATTVLSSSVFANGLYYGGRSASLSGISGSTSVVSTSAQGFGGNGYHESSAFASNGSESAGYSINGTYAGYTSAWGQSGTSAYGYGEGVADGVAFQASGAAITFSGNDGYSNSTGVIGSIQGTESRSVVIGTGQASHFAAANASNHSSTGYNGNLSINSSTSTFVNGFSSTWRGSSFGTANAIAGSYEELDSNDYWWFRVLN